MAKRPIVGYTTKGVIGLPIYAEESQSEREQRLAAQAEARGRAEALRDVLAVLDKHLDRCPKYTMDSEAHGALSRVRDDVGDLSPASPAPATPERAERGEGERVARALKPIIKSLDALRVDLQFERECRCDELDDAIGALNALAVLPAVPDAKGGS